ncbi:nitrous oxide reductase accessory protein NosL [Rhodanobacter aciditrophus]|uniref:nitrous oxide reductase accessory protein NosL n=1 Tax=Rhodanobacter aciditrophus TaxID=1623218 RepID=UPI003CEC1211
MSSRPLPPLFAFVLCALVATLSGCGRTPASAPPAVDVHADDACAVCGMYLDGSPGPRAQAWVEGRSRPLVFDSTRDFFAWVLQPEHQSGVQALYVQDSARIDWRHPNGAAASFIDARHAYYVAWQPMPGSMGPTLASFATRSAATAFVADHGGAVLGFAQVTPALVAMLANHCPSASATAPSALPACRAAPSPGTRLPGTPAHGATIFAPTALSH